MRAFWNYEERRLRVFWRLLVHAVIAIALALIVIIVVAEPLTAAHKAGHFLADLNKQSYDRVINMIVGPLLVIAFGVSVWIAAKYVDRRPSLERFGIAFDGRWWLWLVMGASLGGLLMVFVFGVEYLAGWALVGGYWKTTVPGVTVTLAIAFTTVKVICVATYEELISRGYQLANLREAIGTRGAILLSSMIFALLHLGTENVTGLSIFSLLINGIMFALAATLSGRLSYAIGLHMTWNFVQGAVFGFPVSGDKEGASIIAIQQLGPQLITGGAYGPEGGLFGIAASLLGTAVIVASVRTVRNKSLSRMHH